MTESTPTKEIVGPEEINGGEINPPVAESAGVAEGEGASASPDAEKVGKAEEAEGVEDAEEAAPADTHPPATDSASPSQEADTPPTQDTENVKQEPAAAAEAATDSSAKSTVTKKVVKRVVRASAPAGDPKGARRPVGASSTTTTRTTRPPPGTAAPARTNTSTTARPGHASRPSASRAPAPARASSVSAGAPRPGPPPATAARRTTIGSTRPSANVKENKPPVPRMVRKSVAPAASAASGEVDKLKARIAELETIVGEKTQEQTQQKELQNKYDAAATQANEYKAVVESIEKEVEALKNHIKEQENVSSIASNDSQVSLCLAGRSH